MLSATPLHTKRHSSSATHVKHGVQAFKKQLRLLAVVLMKAMQRLVLNYCTYSRAFSLPACLANCWHWPQ